MPIKSSTEIREKMIKVAIVDDEAVHADKLGEYLARYEAEKGLGIHAEKFQNAVAFLTNYVPDYDIVFLDIRMQFMDGLTAAKRLRELDEKVVLVFVTSLAQYAINGYEVNAADYIVKPFSYADFALKLTRAVKLIPSDRFAPYMFRTQNGMVRIDLNTVTYVETDGHRVIYHTKDRDYTQYSSLNAVEKAIREYGFSRCNTSYLVNLRYVDSVEDFTVYVAGVPLQISHPRKKAFTKDVAERATKVAEKK